MKTEIGLKIFIGILILVLAILGYFLITAVLGITPAKYEGPLRSNTTVVVKVFWPKADSQICTEVVSTSRKILASDNRAVSAVKELLKGPNSTEADKGFISNLPPDVTLIRLQVVGSRALVDFDEKLDYQVAGSCRVESIRSQIEATLKQFPAIEEAVISVNGRVDEVLQP